MRGDACDNPPMIRRVIGATVGVLTLAAGPCACTSGRPGPIDGPTSDPCFNARNAAESRVMKVVEDNQTCQTDADCSVFGVHSTCFDACWWPVNTAGKGAVDRIATMVEAAECKAFHDNACKIDPPACGPAPASAVCSAGKCVDGP